LRYLPDLYLGLSRNRHAFRFHFPGSWTGPVATLHFPVCKDGQNTTLTIDDALGGEVSQAAILKGQIAKAARAFASVAMRAMRAAENGKGLAIEIDATWL
jgi:hypothetical protein